MKLIRYICLGCLVLIGLLECFNNKSRSTLDDISSIGSTLEGIYQETLFQLQQDDILSPNEPITALADDIKVEVFEQDKLTKWHEIQLEDYANGVTLYPFKPFYTEDTRIDISVVIAKGKQNRLNPRLLDKAKTDFHYALSYITTDHLVSTMHGRDDVSLQVLEKRYSEKLNIALFALYGMFIISLAFWLLHLFLEMPTMKNAALYTLMLASTKQVISTFGIFSKIGFGNNVVTQLDTLLPYIDIGLSSFVLFIILNIWSHIKFTSPNIETTSRSILFSTGLYTIINCSILAQIMIVQKLVGANPDMIHIDQVFNSNTGGILTIVSSLLISLGLFLVHFRILAHVFENVSVLKNRLTAMTGALALTSILAMFLQIHISIPILCIGLFVYVISFDLFFETRKNTIIWLLWWMIIVSTFTGMIIFNKINQAHDQAIIKGLKEIHHKPTRLKTNKVRNLVANITASQIKSLASIPYPYKIDPIDLKTFLHDEYSDDSKIDYFILDKHDNSIVEDQQWKIISFKEKLARIEVLAQSGILHDPISDSYFGKIFLTNEDNPLSPFTLYISYASDIHPYHDIDFAYYKNEKLVGHHASFPKHLNVLDYTTSGRIKYFEHRIDNNRVILAKKEIAKLIKPISLSSFIFTILGILLFVFSIANGKVPLFPDEFKLSFHKASLRSRIQIVVIALIVLAFFVIGLVSAFYFKQFSTRFVTQALLDKTNSIAKELNLNQNAAYLQNEIHTIDAENLQELSFVLESDICFFDEFGKLKYTTFNFPHYQDLRIDYQAFVDLQNEPSTIQIMEDGSVDNNRFQYLSTASITSANGKVDGFLYTLLPSWETSSVQAFSFLDFLGTMLNVYVFLFMIAGALAIMVANSITYPIAVLGDKLKRFKLGKKNEALEWKSNDEIGALINEYNNLIVKLDESADLIAKTERDMAWREMAKQVAHEIKNPLTPMKLSIQYLEKAIKSKPDQANELVERVSSTLIEQINNLSQIANEFSNFAKMPQASNEKVILNEVVETIHDLFRKRDDMKFNLEEPINDIIVFADKNHLIRILNNIVKNAIQAIPSDREGKVELRLYNVGEKGIIKISDNGSGIPKDLQDKVFSPYFTTKSSGTGLGLAISANMIDSFNGRIYFETKENEGTDFYIEIPLMRTDKNYNSKNHVLLE